MEKQPIGIIVPCISLKPRELEVTLSWLEQFVEKDKKNIIPILPSQIDKELYKKFSNICKCHRSKGDSITSMINHGMQQSKYDWNFVIKSGMKAKTYLETRLFNQATSNNDILFRINLNEKDFVDTSLDWIYLNKSFFNKIGNFPDCVIHEYTMILWTAMAIEAGCNFKGVAGLRIV